MNQKLDVELEVQRVSRYFLNPENTSEYSGHTLANVRADYQIDDKWDVALRVLNLADSRYAERADFTTFTDERYFPGEPRSAFAEVRYSF